MATSKGVIQGYTGVAAVDEKTHIIIDTQAHGTGSEQALLIPVIAATQQDCVPFEHRTKCLRTPDKTKTRQVTFFQGKRGQPSETDPMKIKIDSAAGRHMIPRRFATVEPVFGNLHSNKRLYRFTLGGKTKVD